VFGIEVHQCCAIISWELDPSIHMLLHADTI